MLNQLLNAITRTPKPIKRDFEYYITAVQSGVRPKDIVHSPFGRRMQGGVDSPAF